jgi:hypothetical protein
MRILSIIFLALLLCSCQTKSNVGPAIVQQVTHCGGHTPTIAIPELRGIWSVKSADVESFQAHLSGVPFADFKSFMQQVYGNPSVSTGEPGFYYPAKDIGVYIQFFSEKNGVGFICHRGHAYPGGPLPQDGRTIILW